MWDSYPLKLLRHPSSTRSWRSDGIACACASADPPVSRSTRGCRRSSQRTSTIVLPLNSLCERAVSRLPSSSGLLENRTDESGDSHVRSHNYSPRVRPIYYAPSIEGARRPRRERLRHPRRNELLLYRPLSDASFWDKTVSQKEIIASTLIP